MRDNIRQTAEDKEMQFDVMQNQMNIIAMLDSRLDHTASESWIESTALLRALGISPTTINAKRIGLALHKIGKVRRRSGGRAYWLIPSRLKQPCHQPTQGA